MRILVTDGDSRAALAVTRSLGRRGHTVIVGERRTPAIAQVSRYCAHRVVYPDPAVHEERFVDALLDTARAQRVDVLLPITDVPLMTVVARRDRFAGWCRVAAPEADALSAAADKAAMLRLAERVGVPVPRTWTLERRGDDVPELPFPAIVKPHRSRVRTPEGWRNCTVSHVASRDALARDLASRHDAEFPLLLQERIVGPGAGVFAACDRGRPVAGFSHRRLREKPPWGGVSVLSESVPLDPVAWEYGTRLLRELAWDGVAMVEFKIDARDGQPRLMEINGRFWGSLQLAIDAGVDFPGILLDILEGTPPATLPAYRFGVKNRWWWGDVDALILRLRAPGANGGGSASSRLATVLQFLRLWEPGLHYESPKLSDLRPFLLETARWFGAR